MPGDPSSGYHESFHVNTAGNYMVVYDLKMQKIYFHNAGTTYHKVTKYYGELLIEEAAAFTGLIIPRHHFINQRKNSLVGMKTLY